MSILESLVKAYDHLQDMPSLGYSSESIHCCIIIDGSGIQNGPPVFWNKDEKGKPSARSEIVPYFGGRSGSNAPPYFLWDNTAYVLGVTAKDGFDGQKRFEEFKRFHLEHFLNVDDLGIQAMGKFISNWQPKNYKDAGFTEDVKDRNIVFRLSTDKCFIHQRAVAIALWKKIYQPDAIGEGVCLVKGERTQIARLHPPIKSFEKQARIVSFDKDNDAFSSYGHVSAANAPTGVEAAFEYTAVINRFLSRGSKNRIQIGDASTVFWADASQAQAEEAEGLFAQFADEKLDESSQSEKIKVLLQKVRSGRPLKEFAPDLADGVRFHVLGLAPNAARLSVRFYFEDDFEKLAENIANYYKDIELRPIPPFPVNPTIKKCVLRLAPARRNKAGKIEFDGDRISPLLAGELMRSILTGNRLPSMLLSLLVLRVRTDQYLDYLRVALIKATIVRAMRLEKRLLREDYLVNSDPDDPNMARRLGRLFALIERAQLASLGDEVNATVKDKFLGAAAATPQQVFVGILTNAQHHLRRLRNGRSDADWIKDSNHARRVGAGLDRDIGLLWGSFPDGLPRQHSTEEQGLFFVGYYQERFGRKVGAEAEADKAIEIQEQDQ